MLINNWYVAAEATDLKDEPLGVRMLGVDLVLFKSGDEVSCLANVCCHRGGALARGKISDGRLACPYHGWTYNTLGEVVKIPALGDDAPIPKRARVDCYPVQERYGYIWVFLGDMSEEERPSLPDFLPEYDDRETWRVGRVQTDWQANWMRLGENFIDSSHLHFVHQFGKHLSPKMEIVPIEETEWGARLAQGLDARNKKDQTTQALADALPKERKESKFDLQYSLVGMMHRNRQDMAPGVTQLLWNAWTPIDECNTRLFSLQLRTFKKEAQYDEQLLGTIRAGLVEDASIVEHIEPVIAPPDTQHEFLLETDGMESMFRKKAHELNRKLGAIDVRKFEQDRKYQSLVIPCPARKADPNNWLHKTVPLIQSEADLSAAAE